MVEIKDRDKHYKRQKFVQLAFYLFEVFFLIFCVLTICSFIDKGSMFGWLKGISTYDFLDKVITIYTLHTLAVFAYVRLKMSARDDANISISNVISHALNMCKYEVFPKEIFEHCEVLMNTKKGQTSMLNGGDIKRIEYIVEQTELFANKTISLATYEYRLENLRIRLNHATQTNNLAWTNSFLLNWLNDK
ncbi:hypothetical protein ABWK42_06645 [Bacillus sp. JJ927]|uniref:hypothetical protein n=1 Tax=Bacillus sp. JJ927 TaxID=3122976 RepID=UPI003398C89B